MNIDLELPPLPPTRVYQRGDKVDAQGRVSALCFSKPRPIDMRRASWTLADAFVTCPKCAALIRARNKTPNGEVRGASPLAGEASSREAATSTVVLGAERPGKD